MQQLATELAQEMVLGLTLELTARVATGMPAGTHIKPET